MPFAAHTAWLPSHPGAIPTVPIERGREVRQRLRRITAPKPPTPACPEYLRRSDKVVDDATAPRDPRYRRLSNAPPQLGKVAYQLETVVTSNAADVSARATPKAAAEGTGDSGLRNSLSMTSKRALAALGYSQSQNFKHEFTKVFAGSAGILRGTGRDVSWRASDSTRPSSARPPTTTLERSAAPSGPPVPAPDGPGSTPAPEDADKWSPKVEFAVDTEADKDETIVAPAAAAEERRVARAVNADRAAQARFEELQKLPNFPPRHSKFMTRLKARREWVARVEAGVNNEAMDQPEPQPTSGAPTPPLIKSPRAGAHLRRGLQLAQPGSTPRARRPSEVVVAPPVVVDKSIAVTPPVEWIVDFGFEDPPVVLATDVLRELRSTVENQRVLSCIARDVDPEPAAADGTEEAPLLRAESSVMTQTLRDAYPGLKMRQSLYVSKFTFVDMLVPNWFLESFAACFRPFHCTVELAFHRCNFSEAPAFFEHLRDRLGDAGVLLRGLSLSFCTGLPTFTGGLSVEEALAPHAETLKALSFHGTYVGRRGADGLARLLSRSSSLCAIDVAYTRLDDEAIRIIGLGIAQSSSLQRLCIDGVGLLHGVGGVLYQAVRECRTLVDVSANNVDRSSTRFRKLLLEAAERNAQNQKSAPPPRRVRSAAAANKETDVSSISARSQRLNSTVLLQGLFS